MTDHEYRKRPSTEDVDCAYRDGYHKGKRKIEELERQIQYYNGMAERWRNHCIDLELKLIKAQDSYKDVVIKINERAEANHDQCVSLCTYDNLQRQLDRLNKQRPDNGEMFSKLRKQLEKAQADFYALKNLSQIHKELAHDTVMETFLRLRDDIKIIQEHKGKLCSSVNVVIK